MLESYKWDGMGWMGWDGMGWKSLKALILRAPLCGANQIFRGQEASKKNNTRPILRFEVCNE